MADGKVNGMGKSFRLVRIALAALVFLVLLAAFSGVSALAARVPQLEFAPALLRCAAAFSLGALAVVLVTIFLTWAFGRFYCAFLCPLGIAQDLAGWLSRRKSAAQPDLLWVRRLVAGAALGMLAGGTALPFLLLDPYSNFGRGVAVRAVWSGAIPLVLVVLLAVWRKRFFCAALCPVGALLGIFSRYGLFKVRFTDKCVKCGMCVKSCPSGCIDLRAGRIDNERCVRCMNCLAACRLGGVTFSAKRCGGSTAFSEAGPDRSRREFLIRGGVLAAGFVAGSAAARFGIPPAAERLLAGAKKLILPPGAGNIGRFAMKCTACQLCTANCPTGIIVPAPGGDGPVRLDLARGACKYGCSKCSAICPTGAIKPLTLEEKRRTKIAEASFDPKLCLACHGDDPCGKCADACPAGAIKPRGPRRVPRLDKSLCIGCGACQAACPATPVKAMKVVGVEEQSRI